MATEKRLMCVDEFKKNLCHYCNTYMSEEPCEPGECWVHDVIAQTDTVPGPSDADPNIMELCFHNGERHMKEKVILLLDAFDKDYTLGDPFIEYDKLRKAMMDL